MAVSKTTKSKTTTRAVAKKPVGKTVTISPQAESVKISSGKPFSKVKIGILVGVVILAGLIYLFRSLFIAAIVNGQVITRLSVDQQLEKQYGKKTLESLVTKNIILAEMEKKNISVSDADVNAEIKKIEDTLKKQGRSLSEALTQQGLSRDDLVEQLKIQKMIEKLFEKDATVSDKEIDAYIEQNKDSFPPSQDQNTVRDSVKTQLKQQKLSGKFQTWLAEIQGKAKIQYFVNF